MGRKGRPVGSTNSQKGGTLLERRAAARGDSVRREGAPLNDIVRHDPPGSGKTTIAPLLHEANKIL